MHTGEALALLAVHGLWRPRCAPCAATSARPRQSSAAPCTRLHCDLKASAGQFKHIVQQGRGSYSRPRWLAATPLPLSCRQPHRSRSVVGCRAAAACPFGHQLLALLQQASRGALLASLMPPHADGRPCHHVSAAGSGGQKGGMQRWRPHHPPACARSSSGEPGNRLSTAPVGRQGSSGRN